MALTKQDIKQIRTVVKEEVKTVVEKEIDDLAGMIKKEFDANTKAHQQLFETDQKLLDGQKQIRKDISHLEFIAIEMVRRDELLEVKQRLSAIEAKLGLIK